MRYRFRAVEGCTEVRGRRELGEGGECMTYRFRTVDGCTEVRGRRELGGMGKCVEFASD